MEELMQARLIFKSNLTCSCHGIVLDNKAKNKIDGPWKEKLAAIRLSDEMLESERNKFGGRERKRVAEMRAMENEQFDQDHYEADEWRAREIAKDAVILLKQNEYKKWRKQRIKMKLNGWRKDAQQSEETYSVSHNHSKAPLFVTIINEEEDQQEFVQIHGAKKVNAVISDPVKLKSESQFIAAETCESFLFDVMTLDSVDSMQLEEESAENTESKEARNVEK
ncbi:hypothetical protein GH714_023987 [Hevea brasiliensis]|uniref:Uncharacterized protein n=1 Tax=Hevea brasiliensis TaxID=3981 RepID=A0A6A6MVG5_HEVBR|nr:hypothetical protein GH714_023987 [Hevea brasiliensis]